MSPAMVFAIGICGFSFLIAIGFPIGFSFALVGFAGVASVTGLGPALTLLGSAPFDWTTQSSFLPVPLFILMGSFAYHSGVSGDLFDTAHKWLGRLPGGLGVATMAASTAFAACTGSSLASAATIGTIAYPNMKKFGYDDGFATGIISLGGTLGILIPPSITFLVYGGITQTNVGTLFVAGILPGLLLSSMFIAQIIVWCVIHPEVGPRGPVFSWRQRLGSIGGVWGVLVLFGLVIGGMFAGVVAPSEAGALGALGALVIGLVKRKLTIDRFILAAKEAMQLTGVIMTMVIGAQIFGIFIAQAGFNTLVAETIGATTLPPTLVMIGILLVYVPLGMFLDVTPMILLTVPIFAPVVVALGYDVVWFGVIVVLLTQLAFVTPPVGMVAYTVHGVTGVPLHTVFRGCWPFIGTLAACIIILYIFPQIALFLPSVMTW